MSNPFLDIYRKKPKRAVPDIPRPNLFSHEKKIKDVQMAQMADAATVAQLQQRIRQLESKLISQESQLQSLRDFVMQKLRR